MRRPVEPFGRPSFRPEDLALSEAPSRVRSEIKVTLDLELKKREDGLVMTLVWMSRAPSMRMLIL